MASFFSLLLATSFAAAQPAGGTIQGKVSLIGLSVGSRATEVREAVIYVEDAAGGELPKPPFEIVQKDKKFIPNMLVVPVGATVSFPNRDVEHHNVFSVGPWSFDLSLYATGSNRSTKFEKPGIVPVFCNIHPQMAANVLVVTNGFFTRPNAEGQFVINGVPAGTYSIVAWFPLGRTVRETVVVQAGRAVRKDFTIREQAGADRHKNKHGKPYARY